VRKGLMVRGEDEGGADIGDRREVGVNSVVKGEVVEASEDVTISNNSSRSPQPNLADCKFKNPQT